ncbi:MAG: zinc ribbon domain-containing protein [Promethearchaeia archaeon]
MQNFWSFDIFKKKLENKCEEYGIELIVLDDRGTPTNCAFCGKNVKPNDRTFKCKEYG